VEGTSVATGKTERIYYIYYRKNGNQIEEKAGRQYQDNMTPAKAALIRAKRIEKDQLSNKENRELEEKRKRENDNLMALNCLFELFLKHKSHLKSLKDDRIRYNRHLRDTLGFKLIEEITPFDIEKIRISLSETLKPATVKQVLVLFKRIVNFSVGKNLCKPISFKIEMPKVNNIKTEILSGEQLTRLLRTIDEEPNSNASNMMKLVLYTGMRRSELFRLQWNDIDFERGFITIRTPKGGTDQIIPLNEPAKKILHNHPRTDSPFVFSGRSGGQMIDNRNAINHIKKRAGLPKDFRPLHGLRHVYASILASSGQVDMYTLQKLLTHKSPQMTQRYAHLRDDTLRKASNLVGELIKKVIKES